MILSRIILSPYMQCHIMAAWCKLHWYLVKHWYCRHATGQFEWSLMSLLTEIIKLPAK